MRQTARSSQHSIQQIAVTSFVLLTAASFLVGGLQGIATPFMQATLTCQQAGAAPLRCRLTRTSLLSRQMTEFDGPVRAEIEVELSTYDGSKAYRVVLLQADQRVPLLPAFYPDRTLLSQAEQINAFIDASASGEPASLQVQQRGPWYSLLLGSLFAYGGGSVLWGYACGKAKLG
jgi:hypothetical protein